MRINAFLSRVGFCSRREAIRLIRDKRITINGRTAEQISLVQEGDVVLLDGERLPQKEDAIYIAFHKPVGVVCTSDKQVENNIISYINYPRRIFPIGRLDKDSEGLLILTNDGTIVNKMMKSEFGQEKEYLVTVGKEISKSFLDGMATGVPVLNTITKECKVEFVSLNQFRIILTQGMNRQIRRMCKYFGYHVLRLQRIRIMSITLEGINSGQWRHLTTDEVRKIKKELNMS